MAIVYDKRILLTHSVNFYVSSTSLGSNPDSKPDSMAFSSRSSGFSRPPALCVLCLFRSFRSTSSSEPREEVPNVSKPLPPPERKERCVPSASTCPRACPCNGREAEGRAGRIGGSEMYVLVEVNPALTARMIRVGIIPCINKHGWG